MYYETLTATVFAVGRVNAGGVTLLGTAFAVGESKMATAAHVVGVEGEGLVVLMPRHQSMSDYQDTTDNQVQMVPSEIIEYDPITDISIIQPKAVNFQMGYELGSTDDSPVGSKVGSFGFPHADHGRLVLTAQNAEVGARILLGSSVNKTKQLVLNTQARPGQSGGPVFLRDKPVVVGMLLGSYAPGGASGISLGGIDPATLHQTTHAISAEYIRAML